jgi:hypothetical protein
MDLTAVFGLAVAVITLFMNDKVHNFLRLAAARAMRVMNLRVASCASVTWDALPEIAAQHICTVLCGCPYPGLRRICRGNAFLSSFAALLATQQKRFDKPLSLDLLQEYFRTDAKTLFLCFMASIEAGKDRAWTHWVEQDYIEFRCGASSLTLMRKGNVYKGEMNIIGSPSLHRPRRTKLQYERIFIHHYPPWYRETVINTANVTFAFPNLLHGNLKRSGWILAIGLGDIKTPTKFFSTNFGDFAEIGGGKFRWGEGTYMTSCKHLQTTIQDRIGGKFPKNEVVEAAVKAIKGMTKHHSASGLWQLLEDTPLENAQYIGALTGALDRTQIEFALSIFNNWSAVSIYEVERLRPILLAVLAGAVRGLSRVFEYLNDYGGTQVKGDFKELLNRNPVVYISNK